LRTTAALGKEKSQGIGRTKKKGKKGGEEAFASHFACIEKGKETEIICSVLSQTKGNPGQRKMTWEREGEESCATSVNPGERGGGGERGKEYALQRVGRESRKGNPRKKEGVGKGFMGVKMPGERRGRIIRLTTKKEQTHHYARKGGGGKKNRETNLS